MNPDVDREHLAAPLAVDQGESSWLCSELLGRGWHGVRRLAVLAWLHRTGPRLDRFGAGPGLLRHDLLPKPVQSLVPSWMPILTPVRFEADDRPLLMIVLYDLDRPTRRPLQIERAVEHRHFDAATFSAATTEVALRVLSDHLVVEAKTDQFGLRLESRPVKPAVAFGADSALVRHGDIEFGYFQRPRVTVSGIIELDGDVIEVVGEGAHDRHWHTSTVANLTWRWLHLRLTDAREINAYVLRDTNGAARGQRCAVIERTGAVTAVDDFALDRGDRGYVFRAAPLDLAVRFEHAVAHPYVPMQSFGEGIDGGIEEAPIRVLDASAEGIAGWLEVFDARTCVVTSCSRPVRGR